MPLIRVFAAIPSSPPTRLKISEVQAMLKPTTSSVRWERSEKFHLTLKFLGDTERGIVDALAERIASAVSSCPPFSVTLSSLGAFPYTNHPRIVWLGAEPHGTLSDIARIVEDGATALGFPKDERAFHPHITLGRVKQDPHVHGLTAALKNCMFEPINLECNEVHLVKSVLHPAGSVYTTLHAIRFPSPR